MKLHFEPDLPYQIDAMRRCANCSVARTVCRSVFTVTAQALGAARG